MPKVTFTETRVSIDETVDGFRLPTISVEIIPNIDPDPMLMIHKTVDGGIEDFTGVGSLTYEGLGELIKILSFIKDHKRIPTQEEIDA